MVGSVGFGRDGIVGKGGTLPRGDVGIGGKGGNVGFGSEGIDGSVCIRWRAARPVSMLEKEIAMKNAKMKQL